MSSLPPTTFGLRSRNDWMSRLERGRSWSCCWSRPEATAWLSSVMLFSLVAATVTVSGDAARLQHDPGLLELLEVRGHDLDPVGARAQVRGLEAALGVGVGGARHAGRLVHDQHRGAGNGSALPIGDCAADHAQERLCL